MKTEPEKKSGLVLGAPTKAKGGYSMSTLKGMKEKQDKSFGKFARGGFAERMMKKMGYKEGQGLGKFDQGMINPVDVKLRVKGSGLGSHGTERTKQSLIHFPTAEVIKEAEIKEKKRDAKVCYSKLDHIFQISVIRRIFLLTTSGSPMELPH